MIRFEIWAALAGVLLLPAALLLFGTLSTRRRARRGSLPLAPHPVPAELHLARILGWVCVILPGLQLTAGALPRAAGLHGPAALALLPAAVGVVAGLTAAVLFLLNATAPERFLGPLGTLLGAGLAVLCVLGGMVAA